MLSNDGINYLTVVIVVEQGYLAQNLHLALVNLCLVNNARVSKSSLELCNLHLKQTLCLTSSVVLSIL